MTEHEQKKRTVEMTNKQWSDLSFFLDLTAKYRKCEMETWENLSQEMSDDGTPRFKHAADNAKFWRELSAEIEQINRQIIKMR